MKLKILPERVILTPTNTKLDYPPYVRLICFLTYNDSLKSII